MQPLNLREWAEAERLKGNEWADEILELIDRDGEYEGEGDAVCDCDADALAVGEDAMQLAQEYGWPADISSPIIWLRAWLPRAPDLSVASDLSRVPQASS